MKRSVYRILSCMCLVILGISLYFVVDTKNKEVNPTIHKNPYFYNLDRVQLNGNIEYYGDGGVNEGIINFEMYKVKEYENGELFHLKINPIENGDLYLDESRLNIYLYVTDDKIYRLWSHEYRNDEVITFYDDDETAVKVWDTEDKILENGVVVCQPENISFDLEDGEYGMQYSIKSVGNRIYYSRSDVKSNGERDFYEWFTWEEGKGLVEYGSGYRAEADILYMNDIQIGKREETRKIKTLFISDCIYRNSENRNIEIIYPYFHGIADSEKEDRINSLILEDVKKIVQEDNVELNAPFCAYLDCEVEFVNENIISICYKGMCGHSMPGQGLSDIVITTNIDIENEKLIALNDIVADIDKLADLLLEDQFESITNWDGMIGNGRISREYAGNEKQLEENLKKPDFDYSNHYVEWYLRDEQFIFVSLYGTDYEEYAMDIDNIKSVFTDEFLSLTQR